MHHSGSITFQKLLKKLCHQAHVQRDSESLALSKDTTTYFKSLAYCFKTKWNLFIVTILTDFRGTPHSSRSCSCSDMAKGSTWEAYTLTFYYTYQEISRSIKNLSEPLRRGLKRPEIQILAMLCISSRASQKFMSAYASFPGVRSFFFFSAIWLIGRRSLQLFLRRLPHRMFPIGE